MKTFAELKAKYPRLIPERFGFQCELGWLPILADYFAVIDRELPEGSEYQLRQVKEKLGSLRIYDSSHDQPLWSIKAVRDAHSLAEGRSYYTCEYCGKRGDWSNRRGYLTTVCEEHAVRNGYRAEPCDEGDYTYREADGSWRRYDPDLDAFVETEAPDWAR